MSVSASFTSFYQNGLDSIGTSVTITSDLRTEVAADVDAGGEHTFPVELDVSQVVGLFFMASNDVIMYFGEGSNQFVVDLAGGVPYSWNSSLPVTSGLEHDFTGILVDNHLNDSACTVNLRFMYNS